MAKSAEAAHRGSAGDHARALSRTSLWLVSLIVPAAFLVVGLTTVRDYGETGDEQFDQDIGRFYYYDWSSQGKEGLERRIVPLQRNYGPLFDVVVVAGQDIINNKLKIKLDPVAAYHVPVLFASVAALWMVFWLGCRLWNARVGLLSALALALMPQFIGHAQNNLKDTPVMVFFALSVLLFVWATETYGYVRFALAGFATGMTYAVKINAIYIPVVMLAWELLRMRPTLARVRTALPRWLVSAVCAVAAILVFWPYYRFDPVARFFETLATFRHHVFNELVFYLGRHYLAHEVPWHFPAVMLFANTPLLHVLFLAVAIGLAVTARRDGGGRAPLTLLFLWLLVPPVAQVLSGAPLQDGIRHYLVVLPAFALLDGWAIVRVGELIGGFVKARAVAVRAYWAAVAVSALVLLRTLVAIHPYQVVFFNRAVGGIAGARERFELDYWFQSVAQASRWINANLPTGSRIWYTMPGLHLLKIDSSRFGIVGDLGGRPNYKVVPIRGMTKTYDVDEPNYLHPKRKPIWAVTVAGADLLQIFEYPEFRDFPDGGAIPPAATALPGAVSGLAVLDYPDGNFDSRPRALEPLRVLSFDCTNNRFHERPGGFLANGYLRVESAGLYLFDVYSDDETLVKLNDAVLFVVPTMRTARKQVQLQAGFYRLLVRYRNAAGPACLTFRWGRGPKPELVDLAAPALWHMPTPRDREQ